MYIIIDKVRNDVLYFNDEIQMGCSLDNIINKYHDYNFNIKVNYYNNYNVVSIRLVN